jgi:hypothetical protein
MVGYEMLAEPQKRRRPPRSIAWRLAPVQRDAELKKLKDKSGMILYCGNR